MTEEQIKQNAEQYALKKTLVSTDSFHGMVENYLAGAHSMLEEIEQLEKNYHEMFCILAKKIEQLHNPWISVHECLPEECQDVLIENWYGLVIRNDYISIGDINYMKDNPELFPRWMLTPKPGLN